MNIKIVFADTNAAFFRYESYLHFISEERKKKIEKFCFDKDKKISLLTELLIRSEIQRQLNLNIDKICFGYGEYGKPYLANCNEYHFSVSHSGNCIVFASSHVPVGIDVELVSVANMKIAKRFFTENECRFIEKSKDQNYAFYEIWTAKEAYVKMYGLSLFQSFPLFDVLDMDKKNSYSKYQYAKHIITVFSAMPNGRIPNIEEVKEEQLLLLPFSLSFGN